MFPSCGLQKAIQSLCELQSEIHTAHELHLPFSKSSSTLNTTASNYLNHPWIISLAALYGGLLWLKLTRPVGLSIKNSIICWSRGVLAFITHHNVVRFETFKAEF